MAHALERPRELQAATVKQRLAAVKVLARHCVQRVARPVEPLNGRELGRLFTAAEG